MVNLKSKWALITGASRGIGRELTLFMASQGVNLVLHSRELANTEGLLKEVRALGVEAFAIAAELSDDAAVREMADEILSKVQIDVLFNNAGVQPQSQSTYYVADSNEYLWSYKVNVIAPMILVEKFLPGMLENGFGRIVNTTSGIRDLPEQGAYTASKGALDKITKDFVTKIRGTGVTMNVLDPGWLRTDLGGQWAPNSVDTVIPGAAIGAFTNDDMNGKWISAQDFTGMELAEAVGKAPDCFRDINWQY